MGLQIQTFLFFHPYKYACHIPDVRWDLNIYGLIMYFFKNEGTMEQNLSALFKKGYPANNW